MKSIRCPILIRRAAGVLILGGFILLCGVPRGSAQTATPSPKFVFPQFDPPQFGPQLPNGLDLRIDPATGRPESPFKRDPVEKKKEPAATPSLPPLTPGKPPQIRQEFPWVATDIFYGHLFPAIELADHTWAEGRTVADLGPAFLGAYANSPYAVQVTSPTGVSVRVEVRCDEFMEPSDVEVKIEKAGEYAIVPHVKWKLRALRECAQTHPVEISWRLWVNGQPLEGRTSTVLAHPADVLPLTYVSSEGKALPLFHYFAAYVNENHPLIEPILKEARSLGIVSDFTGTKSNDPQEVRRQVYAIWRVLQKRGIVYSDISTATIPSIPSAPVCQRVRFFEDVIDARAANCVDGTLIFASLLLHVGVRPVVCVMPGHAFLGFHSGNEVGATASDVVYLETTDLNKREAYKDAVVACNKEATAKGRKTIEAGPESLTCPDDPRLAEIMFDLAVKNGGLKRASATFNLIFGKEKGAFFEPIDVQALRKRHGPIPVWQK